MAPLRRFMDPAYTAEMGALRRGAEDLRVDTKRERTRLGQDFKTARRDIRSESGRTIQDILRGRRQNVGDLRTQRQRGRQDIGFERQDVRTSASRGLRDVGQQRRDVRTEAARGQADFGNQLRNLINDFQTLGRQQSQAGGAAGLSGGSFGEAAGAARASNLAREREPIDTGMKRLADDERIALGRLSASERDIRTDRDRALGRLGTAEERLLSDVARDIGRTRKEAKIGLKRTRKDRRRDVRGIKRERRRGRRDLKTQLGRGLREADIGQTNLRQQRRFQARMLRMGLGRG